MENHHSCQKTSEFLSLLKLSSNVGHGVSSVNISQIWTSLGMSRYNTSAHHVCRLKRHNRISSYENWKNKAILI